jgi:hypothetical protein
MFYRRKHANKQGKYKIIDCKNLFLNRSKWVFEYCTFYSDFENNSKLTQWQNTSKILLPKNI